MPMKGILCLMLGRRTFFNAQGKKLPLFRKNFNVCMAFNVMLLQESIKPSALIISPYLSISVSKAFCISLLISGLAPYKKNTDVQGFAA